MWAGNRFPSKAGTMGVVRKRMWFGVVATVIIGPGFIHRAGFGKLLLPHPPLVNSLLRIGLKADDHLLLSLTHEFGHLQTLPAAFVYGAGMLVAAIGRAQTSLAALLVMVISFQAAWEMMAEALTILSNTSLYREGYRGINPVPRILFWFIMGTLVASGWLLVSC